MINFNQNLYTTQWLDLVFQNRNKSFGAYQLRKHNNETTTKALLYACILFSSAIILPWTYGQMAHMPAIEIEQLPDPLEVNLTKIQDSKPLPPPPAKTPRANQVPLKTIQYTDIVVAAANPANIEPPTQFEVDNAVISTSATPGSDATGMNAVDTPNGITAGTGPTELPSENKIFAIDAIEKYPEFPGGQEAFVKFLRKNLRYPGIAAENGIQGKVILNFIIERNGDLSQIKVIRGIGSGCDEEAIRVLAKSPRWTPGIQNKQSVRVAYNLPINFALSN